ncbi:uncharacterized protein LOC112049323 isoform X2 [Bicyclus anynana]|uniref:Uncharacterized protein LOC112049323 isoform X2 n=1 Tax=Bicyclus anynana TaxID=110368 RepID=A0ABM3M6N3_BICAN|nr:uncharacterized protein LOC112049323 isoform X2 [Bicyclus anynana]
MERHSIVDLFDTCYNIFYAAHVLALAYNFVSDPTTRLDVCTALGYLIDIFTFSHHFVDDPKTYVYKLICYYLRFHRPYKYLWTLDNYHLKGSVVGTALKYFYLFLVLRVTWVVIWLHVEELETDHVHSYKPEPHRPDVTDEENQITSRFLIALYIVNKMFIPIGPSTSPVNDYERMAFLLVMVTGCLVVTGAAVASLSLVISVYMSPEETFRTRYRLIMKEMESSNVPPTLRDKVETFYKMYWHKQRAVSATRLMPIFPPSLSNTIYTDIYFKATQRCRILRDLSYEFLAELAKNMETIHYIPGDAIIKRNDIKSSIIYITYGDIEMLTAEDDSTAMLRMIRGTILSQYAGCPVAGCGQAHVEIRAATYCTAHVLRYLDLWKTVIKYGRENGQGAIVLATFYEHFEKVKRHYSYRLPEEAKYKSSILHFKRNLMYIKESKDAAGNQQLAETDVMIDIAGSYIMRNRADSSLTDEADAICLRPTFPCILQPNSSLQVVWNTFVSCLIITVCITHPYFMVYKRNVSLGFRFYDYIVTVIYIVDLFVYLSTGANVEDGVPITLAQTSSQQVRSKWFVLDVLGTLPIFEFVGDRHFAGINKLLRLPKVFRVLKVVEDECVYYSNILRFFSYSLLLLMSCYLLAALQQGFMCFKFGHCLVTNFTHPPYWTNQSLDDETVDMRLAFGLYWAISIISFTSHIETWGSLNLNHVVYTIFVLEICTVLYIFIEAVYSATIMVTTALREDYDSCIENVSKFLVTHDVDPILRERFLGYLQLCWFTDKGYSMTNKRRSIFYDLPPHVYQDIVARERSKFILGVAFMKLLHKEDLKNISSKAILFCTSPNEILLNTGDMCNEIYIIKKGICEILSPDTKGVVAVLNARSNFGVLECLLRIPTFYTVRAVTHVEIFTISRKHLVNAIDIPQIKEAIDFCKEQPQYSRLQKRREPFTSYQPPEPTPNMAKFRYPRKYEQDNAFLQPFHRLGIFSVLRYIFPRFTIRPDGRYLVRMEWLRASCAFLSAMLYPGYSHLVLQWPALQLLAWLLDLTAYCDILQRMLVGYYNERRILVYHPASTAAHYIRGAFLADLFGCLPLERLESSWKETFQSRYREAPMKQFLMLNRLTQLYRVPSALLGLDGLVRRDLLLVIRAFPLFLAVLNVLTCFVVHASVDIFFTVDGGSNSWYIVPKDDKGGSWITLFHEAYRFNMTESPWNLHLGSLFWVVYETTTTGYNTFKPTNINIMRVLITGMIIGILITTYFSVRIISVRSNVNKALASYQDHMKDISVFMKKEKLNPQLQKQVNAYYEYNWDKTGGIDYRNILKLCSQITLRTDAILHIYGSTFTKCPILEQCDTSLLRIIGRAVRSFYFLKDTTIIEEDDVISDIYFVDRGRVEVKESDDESVTLMTGSMFGNLDEASTIRYPKSIRSTSQVHLLQINSRVFLSIISEFPAVMKLLKSYRPFNEVAFVAILQVVSVLMYMIYVGELSNIIQYKSFRSFKFHSKHLELQEFLKNNRVSRNLVAAVNRYSLHLWRSSRGLQLPFFLTTAPNCLKLKIMSAAYLHHLTNNFLFKDCEPAFLRQLVGFMKLYTYIEDMYVVKEGEITDSMYIIHSGRVTETCENDTKTKLYAAGEHFGQMQGLLYDVPYAKSYITATKSQVLTLYLNDWEDLLQHFPKSKQAIYKNIITGTDDDHYGDDKNNSGSSTPKDAVPPKSPKTGPSSSEYSPPNEMSLRRERSVLNLLPREVSTRDIRLESVDKPYMWPARTNTSSLDLCSKNADQPPKSRALKSASEESQLNMAPTTSKRAMLNDNIISNEPVTLDKQDNINEEKESTFSIQKQSSQLMESVEEYIQQQINRDRPSWLPNKFFSKQITSTGKLKESAISRGLKSRVRIEDNPDSRPTESYELQPVRDLSTDERDLESLDCVTQRPQIDKVSKSPSESSSEQNLSNKADKIPNPESKK